YSPKVGHSWRANRIVSAGQIWPTGPTLGTPEDLYGLDGEETFHFDFEKNKEVYTLPKFGDHFECLSCYELALDNEAVCKSHLQSSVNTWTFLCRSPNILVCQASGFYPAPVNFTWTRDRLTINSSSVSQAFPQSDGTFTQFSTIELLQPEEGQEYICSLEHPALKEPATRLLSDEYLYL
uniref:Ig-like domain-containing protein n=1 Tax=Neogobius melanostomus TaxID=47308 RepID=A0A8C6S3W1_9GOBI